MQLTYMIMDLQYGSTGKGLLAGYLAKRFQPDTLVTAWAANAGHTFIDKGGRKFVHTMLANGVVSPKLRRVLIGPGSVIDPTNLLRELRTCGDLLRDVQVLIHPHAAIIKDEHRDREAAFHRIGSTKKGVGAAMVTRIERHVNEADSNVAKHALKGHDLERFLCSQWDYAQAVDQAEVMQIEGAQGHSLSMYHGFYPYCTSRDVSTAQVLADCAIPHHRLDHVFGTLRTFPIRVANRFGENGEQVGFSGPWFDDQHEIAWSDLGLQPELTTVTKLPRRIATFSMQQAYEAIRQTGAGLLFLNFVNYLQGPHELAKMISQINGHTDGRVAWIGRGPTDDDVEPLLDFMKITIARKL